MVHRGQGVSKADGAVACGCWRRRWSRRRLRASIPGRFGYWLDLGLIMFALYLVRLRGGIVAARPGACRASTGAGAGALPARRAAVSTSTALTKSFHSAQLLVSHRRNRCLVLELALECAAGANAAKLCIRCH